MLTHYITLEFYKNNRLIIRTKYDGSEQHLRKIVTDRASRLVGNGVVMKVTNRRTGAVIEIK